MSCIEKQGYDSLVSLGATPLSRVYTAGGGSKNPAWTAIRERALQVPTKRAENIEASYGAALLSLGYPRGSVRATSKNNDGSILCLICLIVSYVRKLTSLKPDPISMHMHKRANHPHFGRQHGKPEPSFGNTKLEQMTKQERIKEDRKNMTPWTSCSG